jgi:hypothetical protein
MISKLVKEFLNTFLEGQEEEDGMEKRKMQRRKTGGKQKGMRARETA